MSASASEVRTTSRPSSTETSPGQARGGLRVALSAVLGAVLGAAPHVLHHAGPIAGAAVVAGATGTIIFGVLGLAATTPLLLRLRRRTGSWRLPGALLAVFAATYVISTAIVGPALSDDEPSDANTPQEVSPAEHEAHHQ